jgi:hypothetical protein
MRALFITERVREEIKRLKERASANPTRIQQVMESALEANEKTDVKLSDWKPEQRDALAEYIIIPMGYRVAYSVEEQPIGMCGHLSISVDKKGKLPSIDAISAIAQEFGMFADNAWLEEFEPGHKAVNIVSLLGPARRGTA